jgi:hypothetical protein
MNSLSPKRQIIRAVKLIFLLTIVAIKSVETIKITTNIAGYIKIIPITWNYFSITSENFKHSSKLLQ